MYGATISAAGMRLIKLLVGHTPRTTAELIDEIGVTRTAITEQLNELLHAGFVTRTITGCQVEGVRATISQRLPRPW